MAINTHQKFQLDIIPGGAAPVIHCSQGDIGRDFTATIYNSGYSLPSDVDVVIRGKKPDKTVFEYELTYDDDTDEVAFSTTEQMTIISGPVECELVFSNDGDIIASANFVLMVEDSPYNPDALSESDIPTIGDLIEQTIGGDVRDEVDALIEAHPELMLQDGAVTKAKINTAFLPEIENAYVTPDMYGAACDGTTNDAAALGQCFADAAANGLIVYIPKDMVVGWNAPVFMPSNLHFIIDGELRAVGGSAQLETYDRVTSTPGYTSSHDIVVEGTGAVNMRGHILTTGGPSPFRIHHAKNVLIRDISILDCSMYHAIECGGTDGLTVDNVKFKGMHANGMDGWHEYIQLEDITADGTSGAIPYDGTVTKNVIIRNCYFGPGDNGGACYTAIGCHSAPSDYFTNFLIENCEIDESMEFPLRFAQQVKNMTIRNCSITRGGGTYGRGSLYLGDDLHNIVVEGCDFGDTPGRHISLAHVAAPNGEGLTNVTIKNNVFREYGTSGQDVLGLHLAAKTVNLCIKDNVFLNKLSASNRPIHIPSTTLNGYSEGLNITGNVFYSKTLDMDNYQRWNRLMGNKVLYENSSGAKNETSYALTDNYQKYDLLKIRYTVSGTGTREMFVSPEVTQVDIRYTWIGTALTSPFQTQECRMIITFAGTTNPSFTINQNQLARFIKTFDASNVVTEEKVIPERISQSPSGTYNFLQIDKITGISFENTIHYIT